LEKFDIKSGVGFGLFTHKKEGEIEYNTDYLAKLKYLDADCVIRYYTPESVLQNVTKSLKTQKTLSYYKSYYGVQDISEIKKLDCFRRKGDMYAYKAPHIVVKKGLENNKLCASFVDVDCSFKDGVYGFYSNNSEILKAIVAYINSKLSTYFVFMTNSSYGIEREQIMKEEFLSIPIKFSNNEISKISNIISKYIETLKKEYPFANHGLPPEAIGNIDSIIYNSFNLTTKDIAIINDTVDYTLDLFHNKEKSHALHPVKDIMPYAKMLCNEINEFIFDQDLFANPTFYKIKNNTPLVALKLLFDNKKAEFIISNENIDSELHKINQSLWQQQGYGIYFRKKMNYYDGDAVYLIRPNQKRFWTQSAAINDASEIILECLNGI
jgi:hypothetical protein